MSKKNNTLKWVFVVTGLLTVVFYVLFAFISFTKYPGSFGITTDYLSVLGNTHRNPDGAIFYNLAIISSGLLVLLFYSLLYMLNTEMIRAKSILIFSLINALSIIGSAVFPEEPHYELHFLFSFMIFLTFIPHLFLISLNLSQSSLYRKIVKIYAQCLAAFDLFFVIWVLTAGTDTGSIIEWISVSAFLGWVLLLSSLTFKNGFIQTTLRE